MKHDIHSGERKVRHLSLGRGIAAMIAPIITLSWAGTALAGGWIGGGGELLEDAMNPWFVQRGDMKTANIVRYCIEADEPNFGVPLAILHRHVQFAIDTWVDEFAASVVPMNGDTPENPLLVLVAKESFVPAARCDASTPLRFQFGVLTAAQMTEFRDKQLDPRRFVALAARTHYDPKTLQSEGFVYIAPPKGPLGMLTPDMIDDPWTVESGIRLYSVLRHELGHVFGIQHTGTHKEVMGGGFPEYAVSRTDNFIGPLGVFKLPHGAILRKLCYDEGLPEFLVRFFAIPPNDTCIGLKIFADRLEVVTARSFDAPFRTLGRAPLDSREMIVRTEPLVRVWLPDSQTVFTNVPARLGRLLSGPMVLRRQATATYRGVDGVTERELQVTIAPEDFRIGGIWENKIILDLLMHAYWPDL